MANALLWLLHISPQDLHGSPVCIVYDSGYAAGATQRTAPVRSNVEAVALNRRLLVEVQRGRRHGSITFVHVKGHSDDLAMSVLMNLYSAAKAKARPNSSTRGSI